MVNRTCIASSVAVGLGSCIVRRGIHRAGHPRNDKCEQIRDVRFRVTVYDPDPTSLKYRVEQSRRPLDQQDAFQRLCPAEQTPAVIRERDIPVVERVELGSLRRRSLNGSY